MVDPYLDSPVWEFLVHAHDCFKLFLYIQNFTDGVDAALYELDVEHVNASDFRRKDEELLSPDALSLMIAKDLKLSETPELIEQAVSSPVSWLYWNLLQQCLFLNDFFYF